VSGGPAAGRSGWRGASWTGRPIYSSHATEDLVLPAFNTRENIVPNLRDAEYDVNYLEFEGEHEVPPEVSESALDWFLGVG
jgi:predicted esterase